MEEIQDWFWIGLDLTINLILLVGSFLFLKTKTKNPLGYYLLILLVIQIINSILAKLVLSNLYLVSISYYFNFCYLTYYFYKYYFELEKKKFYLLLGLGCLPLIIKLVFHSSVTNFKAYDWVIYDGYLVILTLLGIFKLLQQQEFDNNHLIICFSILLFFGIDFSISFVNNYLLFGKFEIVAWVWLVRAIALLLYFLTLSICTWKILKKA